MANFLNAHLVIEELSNRVQTVWGVANDHVYDYEPRQIVDGDYVVIIADGATKGDGTVNCKRYEQSFTIIGRFGFPTGETYTQFKVGLANDLLTAIFSDRHFMAGSTPLGSRFDVTQFGFEELDEPHSQQLEIRATFTIETLSISVPV